MVLLAERKGSGVGWEICRNILVWLRYFVIGEYLHIFSAGVPPVLGCNAWFLSLLDARLHAC